MRVGAVGRIMASWAAHTAPARARTTPPDRAHQVVGLEWVWEVCLGPSLHSGIPELQTGPDRRRVAGRGAESAHRREI